MSNDLKSKINRTGKTNKGFPAHFKTNLSPVYQREDVEDSYGENILSFGEIPFGYNKGFNSIDQDKVFLHNVDTVLVPVDSQELRYEGAWDISSQASKFGLKAVSLVSYSSVTLSFSGVSCYVVTLITNGLIGYPINVELSKDDGVTWINKKTLSTLSASSIGDELGLNLYEGLEFGDYKVRLSSSSIDLKISFFGYTTYMIQDSVINYYKKSETIPTVEDTVCTLDETTGYVSTGAFSHALTGSFQVKLYADGDDLPPELEDGKSYWILLGAPTSFRLANSYSGSPITFSGSNVARSLKVSLSVDSVPTGITYLGNNTLEPTSSSYTWNRFRVTNNIQNSLVARYKFKGSKCWVNMVKSASSPDNIEILIDGKKENVKLPTIAFLGTTGSSTTNIWVRIDNDSLTEGIHEISIYNNDSLTLSLNGFGFYSSESTSTTQKSLICGVDSEIISVNDNRINKVGTWTTVSDTKSYLGQSFNSSTSGSDRLEITTPANTKAIYVITKDVPLVSGIRGFTVELDSSNVRHISASCDTAINSKINKAFDSDIDGDISEKSLWVRSVAGVENHIEGFIFEIGNAVDNNVISCMPKRTRYCDSNGTTPENNLTTNSHRLDVFGLHDNPNEQCRQPMVQSNVVYYGISGSQVLLYRHGLGITEFDSFCRFKASLTSVERNIINSGLNLVSTYSSDNDAILKFEETSEPSTANIKIYIKPDRVI